MPCCLTINSVFVAMATDNENHWFMIYAVNAVMRCSQMVSWEANKGRGIAYQIELPITADC